MLTIDDPGRRSVLKKFVADLKANPSLWDALDYISIPFPKTEEEARANLKVTEIV